jgi:hypothetical protein
VCDIGTHGVIKQQSQTNLGKLDAVSPATTSMCNQLMTLEAPCLISRLTCSHRSPGTVPSPSVIRRPQSVGCSQPISSTISAYIHTHTHTLQLLLTSPNILQITHPALVSRCRNPRAPTSPAVQRIISDPTSQANGKRGRQVRTQCAGTGKKDAIVYSVQPRWIG